MAWTTQTKDQRVAKIKATYGDDFYRRIGALGPPARTKPSGFASELIGKDGLTGPERARKLAIENGHKLKGKKWSPQHRANYRKAIEARTALGCDVDLSKIDLPLNQVIWYKAP